MQGLLHTILEAIDIFERRMDGESRHRLNMAVLLGGAFASLNERVPNEAEADAVIAEHRSLLDHLAQAHDERFRRLRIAFWPIRSMMQLQSGELLARVVREKCNPASIPNIDYGKELERVGIKIADTGFLVANTHAGLDAVFKDTIWAGGSWPAALRRVDGLKAATSIGGVSPAASRALYLSSFPNLRRK